MNILLYFSPPAQMMNQQLTSISSITQQPQPAIAEPSSPPIVSEKRGPTPLVAAGPKKRVAHSRSMDHSNPKKSRVNDENVVGTSGSKRKHSSGENDDAVTGDQSQQTKKVQVSHNIDENEGATVVLKPDNSRSTLHTISSEEGSIPLGPTSADRTAHQHTSSQSKPRESSIVVKSTPALPQSIESAVHGNKILFAKFFSQ